MNKTIFALSIIAAFVVGSVMTGTMAFGAEKPNGDPFKAIWNAINGLIATDDSLPAVPTGLTTPTQSTTEITPRWNSATGATWYLVYRESPTGGGFSQIANVTALTFSNTDLVTGTQYNYKVFAGNSTGTSLASAPSSNYTNQIFPAGNTFTGSNTFSNAPTFNSGIILQGNITAPNGFCIGAC